ncbi:S9 family peptidase [Paenarthrobacter nicotinovorans]|uniref:S9 family peptidase n=1 Tax=Paenarthrobacter nicotinovorans TaxID=29320 RepID=UPI0024862F7D|nr:S9 family peptidase [Paenarthrobacter nicotinovorans]MDI2022864.1 Dipeptidyl-peptidase 5 [Paenarthrobacter nicotinovorans]
MSRRLRSTDLLDIAVPEQPALSPDGQWVAYVLKTLDAGTDSTRHNIWLVDTQGGSPRQITFSNNDASPAWLLDGSRLSFVRTTEGRDKVCIMAMADHAVETIATLPSGAGKPVWGPDGTRLAFAAFVSTSRAVGDPAETAQLADPPTVADGFFYKTDGIGLLGSSIRQLHVLEPATGNCTQLTYGDWHVRDPEWSPDGGRLAFAAGPAADDESSLVAPAHVVELDRRGAEPSVVGPTDVVVGALEWATDGQSLLAVSSRPVGHKSLVRLPLDGNAPVDLSGALDRNVMTGAPAYPGASPRLTGDGESVLFCIRDRGCTHLLAVDVDGGEPRRILHGDGLVVSELSVAGTEAVTILRTPTSFGEVVMVNVEDGTRRVLTEHGANLADVELFQRQERKFTISDGTVVQGWLIADPEATGPRPLLLDIHGGPHNAWNAAADEVNLYHQELAARGWVVLLLNVRGSDGYGEEFYRAAVGRWGVADAPDFLQPLDELVAGGLADPERLAVTGYSYGGYMACYLTSRDQRFAAAVAGGVVSDLRSFAGTSDSGHFFVAREIGTRSDQPLTGWEDMSPISAVEAVTTPTLILHGADDLRCPVGQAEQWHTALCEQGTKSRMVLYPRGSHLFPDMGPPSHRIDFNRRIIDWVEDHANRAATLHEQHATPTAREVGLR